MSWTKEDQAKLREYQTAQMTVKEIAVKMQRPQQLIRAELEAMGYKPIEDKPKPESEFLKGKEPVKVGRKPYAKITPEIEQKVCELSGQRKSQMQIAIKLDICLSSVKRIMQKHKADKPKPSQINEDFEAAVNEMIAEAREEKAMTVKEKEPAPSANDTSSKEITPAISTINDTTDKPESQAPALTGIKMMMEVEAMLGEVFGRDAQIIDINANSDHCDIGFTYHGREYSVLFAEREEVPDYGNDKH